MNKAKREKQSHLIYATRKEMQKCRKPIAEVATEQMSSEENLRQQKERKYGRGRNEKDLIGLSVVLAKLASSLAFSFHQPY